MEQIKALFKYISKTGLFLPTAYDARTGHGSISLLFVHLTFIMTMVGLILLMQTNLTLGVYCSMGYSTVMLGFYLMRSVGKVKIGKDGVELEDAEPDKDVKNG